MATTPTTVTWGPPDTWADGTPFTTADLATYELTIDSDPAIDVGPVTAFTLPTTLTAGPHTVSVVTVATNGAKSAPATVTFTTVIEDTRVPNPPTSLAVV